MTGPPIDEDGHVLRAPTPPVRNWGVRDDPEAQVEEDRAGRNHRSSGRHRPEAAQEPKYTYREPQGRSDRSRQHQTSGNRHQTTPSAPRHKGNPQARAPRHDSAHGIETDTEEEDSGDERAEYDRRPVPEALRRKPLNPELRPRAPQDRADELRDDRQDRRRPKGEEEDAANRRDRVPAVEGAQLVYTWTGRVWTWEEIPPDRYYRHGQLYPKVEDRQPERTRSQRDGSGYASTTQDPRHWRAYPPPPDRSRRFVDPRDGSHGLSREEEHVPLQRSRRASMAAEGRPTKPLGRQDVRGDMGRQSRGPPMAFYTSAQLPTRRNSTGYSTGYSNRPARG